MKMRELREVEELEEKLEESTLYVTVKVDLNDPDIEESLYYKVQRPFVKGMQFNVWGDTLYCDHPDYQEEPVEYVKCISFDEIQEMLIDKFKNPEGDSLFDTVEGMEGFIKAAAKLQGFMDKHEIKIRELWRGVL